MKIDDLTKVKNIGSARKKLLAIHGITTVQQLYDVPLDKLMQIKSLGEHYAKLIKTAVADLYEPKTEGLTEKVLNGSRIGKKKSDPLDRKLKTELAKTTKYLKRAREKFKPIKRKKHLKLFVEFKKRSNNLKARIQVMRQAQFEIPKKQKNKITKKIATLNTNLKNAGKHKKGKSMKLLSQEIASLLNLLEK